ncbi:alpha/beta hydrolase [Streptomyces sp. ISL-11]|uniref:alpha/beta hydrolase n=1 Tax=Streptomyces sp. ISL-11 TaxID=2819174 RepID=UPI001BE9F1F4|nr:alpha/beta hydrolase [Streptomyces sp. ISL-11]MBT2383722.1 alpha/beta hydrolase [Streptomyces sp. ISL-11]
MTTELEVIRTLVRGTNGKAIDVHAPAGAGHATAPAVLLWHGMGPDERDVLAPVAEAVAARGRVVFVPDWRSDAADGGRAHLLDSLAYVRDHAAGHGGDIGRLVVAGWSAGAGAAVAVGLRPILPGGPRPAAVVGIAGRYDRPARTTGTAPADDVADGLPDGPPVPVTLVHGTEDEIAEVGVAREFAAVLRAHGRPVRLTEAATDHAGIVMSAYDPARNRLRPDTAGHALSGGRVTIEALVAAG